MANLQKIKTLVASTPGLSMGALAEQLGITPQALSKAIRENSTKIETLEAIARILNVPVTVFFEDIPSMNASSGGINVDAGSGNHWSRVSVGGETDRFLSLLEEKDRQMNRLLSVMENQKKCKADE